MKVDDGFVATEVGVIPSEWSVKALGEIAELGRGRVISRKEIEENRGPYPVFSSQTSNNGCMGAISTFDFEGEYVTWTTDGANAGAVFYRSGKFNCTNVCGTIKLTDPMIDTRFTSIIASLYTRKKVVYCGNPKLMNNIMATVQIPLPPLPEQRKVADILSTVDEHIIETESLIDKTKVLKQGLVQRLLTQGIGHTEFKDTEIGRIPAEWVVETIGGISNLITKGSTPTTYGFCFVNEGINFIKIESIDDSTGSIIQNNLAKIETDCHNKFYRSQLKAGDILFAIAGAIGKSVIVMDTVLPANTNQALAIIRLNKDIDRKYVYFQLKGPYIQAFLSQAKTVTAQANISLDQVSRLAIPFPSVQEQHRISSILTAVDNQIEVYQSKLNALTKLKSGLMQQLLTGRIRVKT